MKTNFKEFLIKNKLDIICIIILISTLLLIALPRLMHQYVIGIANWDTYLYLENGRSFAKMGWGDVASISPVVPFILSLIFRIVGSPFEQAIFNLDISFYIIAVLSLYLIFRFRFNKTISFIGSMVFASFTLLYSWASIGGNDIAGVSLTLLTIYLVILANKKSSYFYYLALPIAALAFLARYTAGVMLFAIIFYSLINKVTKTSLKRFITGGIIGVLLILPFLYNFYKILGNPFPFLGQFSGTVSNTKVIDAGYIPDTWYYIMNLPKYLSSTIPPKSTFLAVINTSGNQPTILSYILIILMLCGMVYLIYNIYTSVKTTETNQVFWSKQNKLLSLIAIILCIIMLVSLNNVSYIISLLIFFIILTIIWFVTIDYNLNHLDFDLLLFSLFVIYLIFQSLLSTKNDRYFITVLPFIAYFITLGINWIYEIYKNKVNIKQSRKLSVVISVLFILFLVGSSLSYTETIPENNHFRDVRDSCMWYQLYNSNYNQTIIASDNWPAVTWYLNVRAIHAVPYSQVNNVENNTTEFSKQILLKKPDKAPISYYMDTNSIQKLNYPGLHKIKTIGDVVIYENTYLYEYNNTTLNSTKYNVYMNKTLQENQSYNNTTLNR